MSLSQGSISGAKPMSGDYQTRERMAAKEKAVPLPDLKGKSVLDVGCDHGHWCWLAASRGARLVLGIDRGRSVGGKHVDLAALNRKEAADCCVFRNFNMGKQWPDLAGPFDVVFCFSMYHHWYESCGDHRAIWYWLWRHTREELLWENPVGPDDAVVRINVTKPYNRDDILKAAELYFDVEYVGPALHVNTREVWRCKPRQMAEIHWRGKLCSGGGGATIAFAHNNNRRSAEIAAILGEWPFPGTLNARLDHPFGWDRDYYRAEILDVVDRANLNAEWKPRWARFYPVMANGIDAYAFRFEGENYKTNYLELIAPVRLRDSIEESVDVRSR